MTDREDERRRTKPETDKAVAGWGSAIVAGFIAAAFIGNVISLRRRLVNFHRTSTQGNRSRPGGSSRQDTNFHGQNAGSQHQSRRPQQEQQQQQTWSSFYVDEAEARRLWNDHVQEMERIRRRQEAFDREKMRYKRNYESWQERHGDKWEWKWHGNRWEWQGEAERRRAEEGQNDWWRDAQGQKSRGQSQPSTRVNSAHYAALGLDASRLQPYTDAEIKAAFRAKALEFHPDQNQHDKAEAHKKFQQIMDAYNALRKSK